MISMVSTCKSMKFSFLLTFTFEHISFKSAMIGKLLTAIFTINTIRLISFHLSMKKRAIDKNIMPRAMRFAIIKLAYKNSAIMEIHGAEAVWFIFLLLIIKILHNLVHPGTRHYRSDGLLRYGIVMREMADITIDAGRLSMKV